jgi:sugar/nucleoside kinase (ribokinase family)
VFTVTRGHHGSTSFSTARGFVSTPIFSTHVVDTIGAGDAYFAWTAPCVAAGFSQEMIGFVGNCAGALAVRIVGNKEPVDPLSMFRFITTLLK